MPAESPLGEQAITIIDVRTALDSPKVTVPFREHVDEMLGRYPIDATLSCIAGLTNSDTPKLQGEWMRNSLTAHLVIFVNQIPELVSNDGVSYLAV